MNNKTFVIGQLMAPILSYHLLPKDSFYIGIAGFQLMGLMAWFIQKEIEEVIK